MGSLAGSGLADSLGRKTALLLDAVPLLVGALVSATASSLTSMVMGRIFCGIGIGLASALVPLYISEVSAALHRHALLHACACQAASAAAAHARTGWRPASAACSPNAHSTHERCCASVCLNRVYVCWRFQAFISLTRLDMKLHADFHVLHVKGGLILGCGKY